MPEDFQGERAQAREDRPEAVSPKKKKRSKFGLFLMLAFAALGVGTGLHFSNVWDARPLVWGIVPKIPYAGDALSKLLRVPEDYTLTVEERRARDLREWEKRLDLKERGMSSWEQEMTQTSGDLTAWAAQLNQQQQTLQTAAANSSAGTPDANEEKALIKRIVQTFQGMSAGKAALVVEELHDALAVKVMSDLPAEDRGSILAKMKPKNAARITELMATMPQ